MTMEPVDNFKQIRNLLEFRSEDDFYFLQVLQRKKDHNNQTVNGTNNNSRLIKSYYISSFDYYDSIEDEVKNMCDVYEARACINLNRRSYYKTAFYTLKKISDQIMNGDYSNIRKAYDSCVGKHSNEPDKKWILDIDHPNKDVSDMILFAERKCMPEGRKFIANIPSKNGFHVIMRPFDLQMFSYHYYDIKIQKNSPTNLYIP